MLLFIADPVNHLSLISFLCYFCLGECIRFDETIKKISKSWSLYIMTNYDKLTLSENYIIALSFYQDFVPLTSC